MPIDVKCPSCGKGHKVKDEAAGKKLRCKGCEAVIPIPKKAAAETDADPWETLDENEGGEELPPVAREAPRSKKGSGKKSKLRSSGGMPVAIMVSIGIDGIVVAIMGLSIIVYLFSRNFGGAAGAGIRFGIDINLIQGLLNRQSRTRWQSIILDCVGLGGMLLCVGPITLISMQTPGSPARNFLATDEGLGMVVVIGFQIILWILDIVMLMTQPAKDWCNE
jgi:hypothetical protein